MTPDIAALKEAAEKARAAGFGELTLTHLYVGSLVTCDGLLALLSEREEMREALADKERLDWLEAVNLRTNERNGTVYGWQFDINHNRASLTDHHLPALTIREAIDTARFPDRASEIRFQSAKEDARLKAFDESFPGVRASARKLLGGSND